MGGRLSNSSRFERFAKFLDVSKGCEILSIPNSNSWKEVIHEELRYENFDLDLFPNYIIQYENFRISQLYSRMTRELFGRNIHSYFKVLGFWILRLYVLLKF